MANVKSVKRMQEERRDGATSTTGPTFATTVDYFSIAPSTGFDVESPWCYANLALVVSLESFGHARLVATPNVLRSGIDKTKKGGGGLCLSHKFGELKSWPHLRPNKLVLKFSLPNLSQKKFGSVSHWLLATG